MKPLQANDTIAFAIADHSRRVSDLLRRVSLSTFADDSEIGHIVDYACQDVGLRLRPYLLDLGFRAGGGSGSVIRLGAAIELMQVSTLVTDDFLDKATTRNRKKSIFSKWGSDRAILIGELLKSAATRLFVGECFGKPKYKNQVLALETLERSYFEICRGQFYDLKYEGQWNTTVDQYLEMIRMTTAEFIKAPGLIGATLASNDQRLWKTMADYGINLGLAYQIRDDIIDLIGDPKYTGKPKGGDLIQKKARLPLILGIRTKGIHIRSAILKLLSRPRLRDKELDSLITILHESGALMDSMQVAQSFAQKAIRATRVITDSKVKNKLIGIAKLVGTF